MLMSIDEDEHLGEDSSSRQGPSSRQVSIIKTSLRHRGEVDSVGSGVGRGGVVVDMDFFT